MLGLSFELFEPACCAARLRRPARPPLLYVDVLLDAILANPWLLLGHGPPLEDLNAPTADALVKLSDPDRSWVFPARLLRSARAFSDLASAESLVEQSVGSTVLPARGSAEAGSLGIPEKNDAIVGQPAGHTD